MGQWSGGRSCSEKSRRKFTEKFQKAFGKNDKMTRNDKKNDRALPGFQNMRIK